MKYRLKVHNLPALILTLLDLRCTGWNRSTRQHQLRAKEVRSTSQIFKMS